MRRDRDVDEEIRFHLEKRTEANIRAGMSPGEARARAERSFGDPERVRRAGRAFLAGAAGPGAPSSLDPAPRRRGPVAALGRWLSVLLDDIRYGVRTLARNGVTTVAAVASLALGIGVNTANFSIVHGVLLRPLPFERAEGLLFIDAWNPERGDGDAPITWADLGALRSDPVFAAAGAFQNRAFTITGGDRPERIAGAAVTPGLFDLLGVRPQSGRMFLPEDAAEPGFEPVALMSDGLWRRRFGADPDIVGRTIHIDGREVVVAGVMEPGFRFPEREDLWIPLGTADPTDHTRRNVTGVARLRDGATLEQARAVGRRWTASAAVDFPDSHEGWTLRIQPFRFGWVDASTRQTMVLLLAAVGFVLLLACANVAALLLARATDRRDELAVRNALGAGRLRLAHQVLVESLLLGLAGGGLGVLVARAWVEGFIRTVPEETTYWIRIGIDGPVLLYAVAVTLATSLLFGVLPSLQASRAQLGSAIRDAGRGILGARGRARAGLVVVEVGLAVVLLVSATLMVRSALALQAADPGFPEEPLLSFRLVLAGERYQEPAARASYYRRVEERLSALPGAAAAVATSAIPADDGGATVRVRPEGAPDDEVLYASAILSTRGLFETLGVAMLSGRDFTDREVLEPGSDVAVVGRRLARRLWPGEDPVGRRLVLPGTGSLRVLGVAPDLQYEEFGEDLESARLQVHLPYGVWNGRQMAVLVRAAGDPAELVGPVRRELEGIDPTLAPWDVLTMGERRAQTTWGERLVGESFAVFGGIAVVLALCGIYGVIAYSVARRTKEIGIRIALGAGPGEVRSGVVGHALALAGAGAAGGLALAVVFARALRGLLYGVNALDPSVFGGVAGGLLLAAAVASWIPAHRAARVDPTDALRTD